MVHPPTRYGSLSDQVGIVTGGGKGLGRAFCRHLAAAGARVVVNNRHPEEGAADRVVSEIRAAGGEAVAETSDVAADGAADRMVATALQTWGRLDFLVANAAVAAPAIFHRADAAEWEAVVATNVFGTSRVTMAAARHMRAAGGGRIVLVSSTAGLHGEPTASAYAASKGAVIALGRTLGVELAGKGIRTNVVLPYAATAMTGDVIDRTTPFDPMQVAPVVTALVDPEVELTGRVIVCGGGSVRQAGAVEWGSVPMPATGDLRPAELADLLERSAATAPRAFPDADSAFSDFSRQT